MAVIYRNSDRYIFQGWVVLGGVFCHLPLILFSSAVLIYALFGSPTPDHLGWVELIVGMLLCVVFLKPAIVLLRNNKPDYPFWVMFGFIFLLFGLCVGLIGAAVSGASFNNVIRDVLPFGFLFLPLLLIEYARSEVFSRAYFIVFICLGLCFSLRATAPLWGFSDQFRYDFLYYLGNSPAVLFAALFTFGFAIMKLMRGFDVRSIFIAFVCFFASFACVLPMIMTSQRASLLAVVIYVGVVFSLGFARAPRRMMLLIVVFAFILFNFFSSMLHGIYNDFIEKSRMVGANMRFEEWQAVWSEISSHPLSLFFGVGWGTHFSSPAVADVEVNYTHSLLSAMLLKLGLLGFVMCGAYIGGLIVFLFRHARGHVILIFAIMAPLLIDVFLYAAYKSFDFGLLLGMISVVCMQSFEQSRIASYGPVRYENSKGDDASKYA
ncbi:MAG: O-antigen ligase family protein [Bdellovibrionales bacterium]